MQRFGGGFKAVNHPRFGRVAVTANGLPIFVGFVLLAFSLFVPATSRSNAEEGPFPMSEGTYWLYRGTVRWTHDINQVSSTNVFWRTEVRRLIRREDLTAAIVNGFPSDLDWSDGNPKPLDSLLVESGGKFYLMTENELPEGLRRLQQPSGNLLGLLRDEDLFLEWPLQENMKFCEPQAMTRPDDMYCWFVASSQNTSLSRVRGVPQKTRTEFVIQYRTNPDHIEFNFVPGIGITKYDYHRHGTVADTELELVEFHSASND